MHSGLPEMAAAYLYHICQNHAFTDGNKRTAAFAMVLFLALNGVGDEELPPEDELETLTWRVARGEIGKSEIADWLCEKGLQ